MGVEALFDEGSARSSKKRAFFLLGVHEMDWDGRDGRDGSVDAMPGEIRKELLLWRSEIEERDRRGGEDGVLKEGSVLEEERKYKEV